MRFITGPQHATDLTDEQILKQCKMYIAALRIADDFGCHAIGIQYQQGLKDLLPASDLVEGTLNNTERPPVRSRDGNRVLYDGQPLPHFNEVDECAGLDALMTYRVHGAMHQPVENTLHDVRWGDWDQSGTVPDYVWVLLISGSAPPAHFTGGWKGASSERQPPMYFPAGGGTLKGVSKPGEIVWSRIYVEGNRLAMDLGRAGVVELPPEETHRRWQATTPQWPIMHAVTYGVSRDQLMARHKANHIQVAYANSAEEADRALMAKAVMAESLGLDVFICGTRKRASRGNSPTHAGSLARHGGDRCAFAVVGHRRARHLDLARVDLHRRVAGYRGALRRRSVHHDWWLSRRRRGLHGDRFSTVRRGRRAVDDHWSLRRRLIK